MSRNFQPIKEEDRNINWEEVEYKVKIICNKFRTSVEPRFIDDLAQELRIHAYYKSDDYYDLQRKAIDFWRSLKVNHMPEMPYFDLEFLGTTTNDNHEDVEFQNLVQLIQDKLNVEIGDSYADTIRSIAIQIFDLVVADITEKDNPFLRKKHTYVPYHNQRISCSYLWEILGDNPGDIKYRRVRAAVKMLEGIIKELDAEGLWSIDEDYLK